MDETTTAKLLATLVMLCLALLAGFLPLKVRSYLINQSTMSEKMTMITLSASLCFGAGVLMATVFLHIMIETRERFSSLVENGYIAEIDYPIPELVICMGFFLIYLTEEFVHLWAHKQHEIEHHNEEIVHPSFKRKESVYSIRSSIKRCETTGSVVVLGGCEGQMSSCCEEPHKNEGGNSHNSSANAKDDVPQANGGPYIGITDLPVIPEDHSPTIDMKPHGDDDSEGEADTVSMFRSVLVILALSLHGMFEGIALGLEGDRYDVWLMCAALSAHKIFIGFSIGMELLEIGIKKTLFTFHMMIFSFASPIGAIFGTVLSASISSESVGGGIAMAILQGISGGTILYVTFCEVLERERTKVSGRFIRLLALMAGFTVMAGLQALDSGHDHSGSPSENSTVLFRNLNTSVEEHHHHHH